VTPLVQLAVWLNAAANALARFALAPVAWLPGWLSATAIAVVTGAAMLLTFKYTSRQAAIKATRNQIKANLLALSLFKDELRVGLRAQRRLLAGAGRLIGLSLAPMLVMALPMCLLLGQLALWYQARPLRVGEEAVVAVRVAANADGSLPEVTLRPGAGFEACLGPVRVPSKGLVCWNVKGVEPGLRTMEFEVADSIATKELAVGAGFMPTSLKRPEWSLAEALLHPRETPFPANSTVQSIEVAFPDRDSWTSGSDAWVIYWFVVSIVAAFAARPILKVNI
jgi:hypothetical protein